MNLAFKGLIDIESRKDGDTEIILIYRSLRVKHVVKIIGYNLTAKGLWVFKNCVLHENMLFRGIIEFSLAEHLPC